MKLLKVKIGSFRSIKNEEISFEKHNCRILIGKNEAGKSNVLKAVSALSKKYEIKKEATKDKRIRILGKDKEEGGKVSFYFELKERERKEIFNSLSEYFYCEDINKAMLCDDHKGKGINLLKVILEENIPGKIRIDVDLEGKNKLIEKIEIICRDGYIVSDSWKKLPENHGVDQWQEETLGNLDEEILRKINDSYSKYKYINIRDHPQRTMITENDEDPSKSIGIHDTFDKVKIEDIENDINECILTIVRKNTPAIFYWDTLADQSFESIINIDKFIKDIDAYPDFKNMCLLASDVFKDEDSISPELNKAKDNNQLTEVYRKISEASTKYLQNIWSDFKGEQIFLDPSSLNSKVRITVQNKRQSGSNCIEVSDRSDGFKKFLKLMLSLSLRVDSNEIKNSIILIDEAEVYLHPSSAECFRDELIKLSTKNNNIVLFSTHSPFMIDSNEDYIGRHIMVEKSHEVTQLKKPEVGKYFAEELLWNAMGCGVIRTLPPKTIMFEGFYDRELFKKGLKKLDEKERKKLTPGSESKLGIAHAGGASHIRNIAPAFGAADAKLFIVCDSDKDGNDEKDYFKDGKLWGHNNFYTLYDLGGEENQTAEDYVKKEKVEKAIKSIELKYKLDSEGPFILEDDLIMPQVKKLLSKKDKLDREEITKDLKSKIFSNLEKDDIKNEYKTILKNLSKKISDAKIPQ